MSKQTMKNKMSINQKDNRMKLEKYSTTYKKVKNKSEETNSNLTREQEEVANFTKNTLRSRISTTWFEKNKIEIDMVKSAKVNNKHSINTPLRNEYLSIIAKSNPRFNVKLIIA